MLKQGNVGGGGGGLFRCRPAILEDKTVNLLHLLPCKYNKTCIQNYMDVLKFRNQLWVGYESTIMFY